HREAPARVHGPLGSCAFAASAMISHFAEGRAGLGHGAPPERLELLVGEAFQAAPEIQGQYLPRWRCARGTRSVAPYPGPPAPLCTTRTAGVPTAPLAARTASEIAST
ncbi:MAG: hypothetical protein WEA81_02240, partial [Dehalococcoidia bacterium]